MLPSLVLAVLLLAVAAFFLGRAAARRALPPPGRVAAARPAYHGAFLALAVGLPTLGLLLAWAALQPGLIDRVVLSGLPLSTPAAPGARDLLLAQVHAALEGHLPPDAPAGTAAAAARLRRLRDLGWGALFALGTATMLAGFLLARRRIGPGFRARQAVEGVMTGGLVAATAVAVLAYAAIVLSLARETVAFFRLVPPAEFFGGLSWDPDIALRTDQVAGTGAFGAAPVFFGTALVAGIAMLFAAPVGILAAIHLAEYASARTRRWLKPFLEVLAGMPTIAYGLFALLAVAPAVQRGAALLGLEASPNSALAVGLVVGIMVLPLVALLSENALRAVSADLREASLALGATRAETMLHVLLPAAGPGIAGALLLALSRAVGETMIVVLAAGLVATLSPNPLGATTTVTAQIVTLLAGDAPLDNPRTLAAYALGLVLFAVTFGLNLLALRLVRWRGGPA